MFFCSCAKNFFFQRELDKKKANFFVEKKKTTEMMSVDQKSKKPPCDHVPKEKKKEGKGKGPLEKIKKEPLFVSKKRYQQPLNKKKSVDSHTSSILSFFFSP